MQGSTIRDWIRRHPVSTAALGIGLGLLATGCPYHKTSAKRAKSRLKPRKKPWELSGEFKDLLETPPAI